MDSDVPFVWRLASRVPSQKVHFTENLFELFLLGGVVIPVDDDVVADAGKQQFERIHYLDVAPLLFADQSSVDCEQAVSADYKKIANN